MRFVHSRPAAGAFSLDSDWERRKNEAGVFYWNNFSFTNQAQTSPMTTTTQLRASGYGGGVGGPSLGDPTLIEFDTSIKLSGAGSCRYNMPASDFGAYCDLGFTFDGVGVFTKNTSKFDFYLGWSHYADSVYRNFDYGDESEFGGKILIISANNQSANADGAIVIRRDPWGNMGVVRSYYYDRIGGAVTQPLMYFPSLNDWAIYDAFDKGSGAVTTLNELQQRFGPNWGSHNSSSADADAIASGAPFMKENGWTRYLKYVKMPTTASDTGILKLWMAHHGEAPQLVLARFTARLPVAGVGMDNDEIDLQEVYSGFQCGNYPNDTVAAWPGSDTFVCYDELLASDGDSPPTFPGNAANPNGYAIPYPGDEVPPGYPPTALGGQIWTGY